MITIESYSSEGGRAANEDTCLYCSYEKNLVFVLADGLGGHGDGKRASETACEELILCGADNEEVTGEKLVQAFDAANQKILKQQENEYHMKTTAVYLCISADHAIWAHIGDSRLYHFYNGKLEHYTLDHSIAQVAVSLGEISRENMPKYPGRSKIFHALGTVDEQLKSIREISLEPGAHAFLLCSDGVWELLSDEMLTKFLSQAATAQEWITLIRQSVEERMPKDHDNNSAIAVMLQRKEQGAPAT